MVSKARRAVVELTVWPVCRLITRVNDLAASNARSATVLETVRPARIFSVRAKPVGEDSASVCSLAGRMLPATRLIVRLKVSASSRARDCISSGIVSPSMKLIRFCSGAIWLNTIARTSAGSACAVNLIDLSSVSASDSARPVRSALMVFLAMKRTVLRYAPAAPSATACASCDHCELSTINSTVLMCSDEAVSASHF